MFVNDVTDTPEITSTIIAELRENYGIKYRKEKKQKNDKTNHRKIFHTPMEKLQLTDVILANGRITQVPLFVSDACQRILDQVSTEGLFRKAGSAVRQREIKANLEGGARLGKDHHVIDVANILKLFFRELPDPIFPPGNIQDSLLRCLLCGDRTVTAVKLTCLLLPSLSLNTLAFFMQFLHTVSVHSDRNKMSVENLSIVFAPGLMPLTEILPQRLNSHCKIIHMLIENANEIGIVPRYIVDRVQLSTAPKSTPAAAPDTDKKKKKRRSGSLTRMFNGLRKIVGARSTESLDNSPELNPATPCLNKTAKKRKVLDGHGFSAKKKKEVLALLPENGGILPCTPIDPVKTTKKSRLSLGGKRHGKQPPSSTVAPTMERRWSVVGTAWNRKKLAPAVETLSTSAVPTAKLSPTLPFVQSNNSIPFSVVVKNGIPSEESDFMRVSKSEYKAITERVSAIESRISQEFNKVHDSMMVNSSSDMTSPLNGPEKVLDKYEKTLEETGQMSTPSTDQLAKRLSRELKIRRSAEHRIIRSPSARKIGTMRRRSRENIRLSRNQSWHLAENRPTIENKMETSITALPTQNDDTDLDPFFPKVNLKRGRPNTVQTGLRHPSPTKKNIFEQSFETETKTNNCTEHSDNEQWISAEQFFGNKSPLQASNVATPAQQRFLKQSSVESTPNFVSKLELGEMKTPMLPPRIPIRRTPFTINNHNRTPLLSSKSTSVAAPVLVNKILMPLQQQEQQTGRASIARLRSQNAGMVAAKARLFNGFVTETSDSVDSNPSVAVSKPVVNQHESKRFIVEPLVRQPCNRDVTKLKQTHQRKRLSNSPRKSTTPRRGQNNGKHAKGVHRRQKLRLGGKSPVKKSPMHLMNMIATEMASRDCGASPKQLFRNAVETAVAASSGRSPTVATPKGPPATASSFDDINFTPHIKRPLQLNSPRRLLKSHGREQKRSSPLRATPIKLRSSPRLQLQRSFNATPY